MTIIFSNMGDQDCQTLRTVWQDLPDVKLIEITSNTSRPVERVTEAMEAEEDTILFLGHGTPMGLLCPNFKEAVYLFSRENLDSLKAKNVFCCWCNASSFCLYNEVKCFCTSMFISNIEEAYYCGCEAESNEEVDALARRFYEEVNGLLRDNTPLDEWLPILRGNTDNGSDVDVFNRRGLFYLE